MKLSLAPIQGMTTAPFRKIYNDIFGGFDTHYAPFVSTTHMRKKNSPLYNDLLPSNNSKAVPLVPQILGNNSEDFKHFASTIASMGYEEINWNIGCPYHKVTRKLKGSGLLAHPDLIKSFLDDVCSSPDYGTTYKLTVKMRLGLNHYSEGEEIIRLLNDYPLGKVILHARLGQQIYSGTVDLDAFGLLLSKSNHTLVYNGDIFSLEDYQRISGIFPSINEFMIGRGALRNPFLASQIKGKTITREEGIALIIAYHDASYRNYKGRFTDEGLLCNQMKEFWTYASYQIDSSGEFLDAVRRCTTLADYDSLLHNIFY